MKAYTITFCEPTNITMKGFTEKFENKEGNMDLRTLKGGCPRHLRSGQILEEEEPFLSWNLESKKLASSCLDHLYHVF